MKTFQNKANHWKLSWCCRVMMNLVESHYLANSTIVMITLFAFTNYHWSIWGMVCFILFLWLSFPYWLWRRVIPFTCFPLRVHGGSDLSAEDTYFSVAPDPTFEYVGVNVALDLILCLRVWLWLHFKQCYIHYFIFTLLSLFIATQAFVWFMISKTGFIYAILLIPSVKWICGICKFADCHK
jgi:hypothetical protein